MENAETIVRLDEDEVTTSSTITPTSTTIESSLTNSPSFGGSISNYRLLVIIVITVIIVI